MRVGVVCPYSVSWPGGVQAHVLGLARELTRRGHDVYVLAPCDGPPPDAIVDSAGRSYPVSANGSVARLALTPAAWRAGTFWPRRRRLDVVHVHEPFAPMVSLSTVLRSDAPVVGTFHAAAESWWPYERFGKQLQRAAGRLSARTAVSGAAEALAAAHFDGPFARTPNGVDHRFFANAEPAPSAPDVLFVGRLEERKGARVMVEAAKAVDATVGMVGDGPLRTELAAAAPANVRFLGTRSGSELARLYRGARVVCLPSLHGESFGVVVLEAMAAGANLVVSDIPGYRAVAGDTALLSPPGDAVALARTIAAAVADPSDRGARAGERAREFAWERLAETIEGIYLDAI